VYSARDVAAIVGLSESRVRYWAQTGFVGPSERMGGRAVYTFQDLVALRAAKELLEHGVTLQRARRGLEALRAQLPSLERPLAELRVISDGDRLVVAGDAPYEPLSGQLVMSFEVADLSTRVAEVLHLEVPHRAPQGTAETAYGWFLEGMRHEHDRPEEAISAYRRALEADPHLAAAHTNLGTLLCARGELAAAKNAYQTALEIDPEQPEARYNLGNLMEDDGEQALAIGEWLKVVTAYPEFADAHYNLARAFAASGAPDRARVHAHRYLELDAESEWAERARSLLSRLPS
jgi:Tfp pilus assembly protein PilF